MTVGGKLKKLREFKGLKQKEVAEMIGISPVTYNRYEKDVRQPDFETLLKICQKLQMSSDYFFIEEWFDLDYDYQLNLHLEPMDYNEELDYFENSLRRTKIGIKIIIRRMDQITNGDKPQKNEEKFLRARLRELYFNYNDYTKTLEKIYESANLEANIIEHLKF
ncbi:MAG: helix-turn-helix transcriptional regulator [Tenericutes bacterium]|nr:helix-turn-helix transcriptional regulator [Mycoplasmatota bacterium]